MSEHGLRRADTRSGKFAGPSEKRIHPGHEKTAALLRSRIGIGVATAAKERLDGPAEAIDDGQGERPQKLCKEKTRAWIGIHG